jgi:metal-responsive CopG/Arc/MetJ family transcriptional regulator
MSTIVKKTISLPEELANEAEEVARSEGKTFSGVVQDALRQSRAARLKNELRNLQDYWSRKAKDKGILTEKDLERYLGK